MPYPTPIVEICFGLGPYASDAEIAAYGAAQIPPTSGWDDVTQYVWRMDIDRGRGDDWGDFNSFASVTFNNRTRRFDPYYTAGPYYGKLLPRKQIRIRATAGGTTYDVFRGYVDGWNPEWTDAGQNSSVTVSCFDALQLLAAEQLPADWSRSYILSTSPRHYYPCDEPITAFVGGQTVKDYGSYPLDLTTTTSASQGPELGVGLPSKSIQGTEGNAVTSPYGPIVAGTVNFSFACWAIFDGGANGSLGYSLGNAGAYITFDAASSKYQVVVSDNYSGLIRTYTTVNTYDSGTARFFAYSWNATSKALTLWIDGVVVATTATTAGAIIIILGESIGFNSAQAQCIIAWQGILSTATVQNIYNYSSAYFPETTAARFDRILNETVFPAGLRPTPTGTVNSVLDITNNAPRVSDELRINNASEGGQLFVSKNGTITMFNQNQIRTQTRSIVSQVTYGNGGTKLDPSISITSDGDSMRNVVNVTMSGGGVYEQTNTTSANAYGVASMSLDTQVQTLANAQSLANIVTGWGGQVYPDLSPAKVVLSGDGTWGPTLGLELMDRITVNIAPPTGNVISTPQLVQRIRHEVVPGLWVTTLDGSARWAAVFIVGQSTIGGTDLLA